MNLNKNKVHTMLFYCHQNFSLKKYIFFYLSIKNSTQKGWFKDLVYKKTFCLSVVHHLIHHICDINFYVLVMVANDF